MKAISILTTLLMVTTILSACAVKPVSSTQNKDKLTINLSGTDHKNYMLIDANGKALARDNGKDKKLSFSIPKNTNLNQCFAVVNENRRFLDNSKYSLSLIKEYRAVDTYKNTLEQKKRRNDQKLYSTINANTQTREDLVNNRAFQNLSCTLPKQRPLPSKPYTKCNSYNECLQDGGAICYTRFWGSEGCSLAAQQLKISGMLATPTCSALVAKMAGEKYDMGDVVVDFLHGMADDAGNNLMKSNSVIDRMFGGGIIAFNYAVKARRAKQCAYNFADEHYGPKRRWLQKISEIRAEPQRSLNQCHSLVKNNKTQSANIKTFRQEAKNLSARYNDIAAVHQHLSNKISYNNSCSATSPSKQKKPVTQVKRYTIGVSIKDYITGKDQRSSGVQIMKIFPKTPAQQSELKVGDIILSINGEAASNIKKANLYIQASEGKLIDIVYLRNRVQNIVSIRPRGRWLSLYDI